MIPVQELCVGNWVFDGERTQFPMQIVAIGEDFVYLDFDANEGDIWESTPDELMGIPLSDELLNKIGFSFKNGLWRHAFGIKVKPETGFVNIENKDDERALYGTCNCRDVLYLHQLQNLVKIITKKYIKVTL